VFFLKHDSKQFNPTSHLYTELPQKYILLFKTWKIASKLDVLQALQDWKETL